MSTARTSGEPQSRLTLNAGVSFWIPGIHRRHPAQIGITRLGRDYVAHTRLLIVGVGPDRGRAQVRRRRGYLGACSFLGLPSEERRCYAFAAANYFCVRQPVSEFRSGILEATACMVPAVCCNHGGQTEFLTDGVSGFGRRWLV